MSWKVKVRRRGEADIRAARDWYEGDLIIVFRVLHAARDHPGILDREH